MKTFPLLTLLLAALSGLALPDFCRAQLPVRVKDIISGAVGSEPEDLTAVGNTLFFVADDGTGTGRELWKSDGTEAGTVLVKDIRPGPEESDLRYLTAVGNTLFFVADDGTSTGRELWKSDGTEAGTVLVKNINPGTNNDFPFSNSSSPNDLTVVGNTLYFQANDGSTGEELWKSDGTEAGTVLVKDIYPGTNTDDPNFPFSYASYPQNLTAVGSMLFFRAQDEANGTELWKSDGTEAGTVLVKDIQPGADGSFPGDLTAVGNTLFFSASDGTNGDELWKSDGSTAGTVLVKDINPTSSSNIDNVAAVGNTLYFRANDGTNGTELWKSDGTGAGTVFLKDINPGSSGSFPERLTAVGSTLFFRADDGTPGSSSYELWKSDGTPAGTVLVKDLSPERGSDPRALVAFNGLLYFNGDDRVTGDELWKSDGTVAGTVLVADIYPGSDGSAPENTTVVGNTLYFVAEDAATGRELWKLDAPAAPCDPRVAGLPTTPGRACRGEALAVTFALAGSCPNPPAGTFTVQLSNAFGSFANPTTLGEALPGTTNLALPVGLPAGTGYRVRILSGGQTSAASAPFQVAAPSLSVTPTVGGAPVCRGQAVTVGFSLPVGSCAFPGDNAFTAQLSSASGSFNNPTVLGTVPSGGGPVTIPASVSAGSGYRIRVVSSNPALTSASSAAFRVNACNGRLSAEETHLVVAPNPVRGSEIRVRVSGLDNPQFSLTTAAGRAVGVSVKNEANEFVLTPRQGLAPGLYVVRASEGALRLSQRVIVAE